VKRYRISHDTVQAHRIHALESAPAIYIAQVGFGSGGLRSNPRPTAEETPMRSTRTFICLPTILVVMSAFATLAIPATAASRETVLHDFGSRGDGYASVAGMAFDKAGHLYGTTPRGGSTPSGCGDLGCGVVFRLTRTGQGRWKETILYSFTGGKDGGEPEAGVIFDSQGNLYGTAYEGGNTSCGTWTPGCGVVFELTPAPHGEWREKILHTFRGADGKNPAAALIMDSAGNLYGTTWDGGTGNCFSGGCGVVFELTPTRSGRWKEKVLYRFTGGDDGGEPAAGLVFDAQGDLYGTAEIGGLNYGVVFELVGTQGKWRENVLHSFSGADGRYPLAGLIFGPSGSLYGTTLSGGNADGGVAFEIRPAADGRWIEKTLHEFCCKDGNTLYAGLTGDAAGNLFGATLLGGAHGGGAVFELAPGRNNQWTETVLYNFGGTDGRCTSGTNPEAGLIFDAVGNLYGTTSSGGTACGDAGVAFQITPQLGFDETGDWVSGTFYDH
jgi:hypothetical protein